MLLVLIILAIVLAASVGFILALWSIQSGRLDPFDSTREHRLLQEQLHTLQTAHALNLQAWQTRRQLQDEQGTWTAER